MTIDEAIKILQLDHDIPGSVAIEEVNEAELLGIEALKRIQKSHTLTPYEWQLPLPGEIK